MPDTTTWRHALDDALAGNDEKGVPVILSEPNSDWDQEFDPGYGGSNGPPVLAWTETRVYFPVVYDGAEWFGSAPRHPRPKGQSHVGGE